MPRHQRMRKIVAPPRFGGYKPYGCHNMEVSPVELFYEEYEAIKLADYKLMNHQEAALLMDVSRATFARIYESARRKIALALVETREIITRQGNTYSDKTWYNCRNCNSRYTLPVAQENSRCPRCHDMKIDTIIKTNK